MCRQTSGGQCKLTAREGVSHFWVLGNPVPAVVWPEIHLYNQGTGQTSHECCAALLGNGAATISAIATAAAP